MPQGLVATPGLLLHGAWLRPQGLNLDFEGPPCLGANPGLMTMQPGHTLQHAADHFWLRGAWPLPFVFSPEERRSQKRRPPSARGGPLLVGGFKRSPTAFFLAKKKNYGRKPPLACGGPLPVGGWFGLIKHPRGHCGGDIPVSLQRTASGWGLLASAEPLGAWFISPMTQGVVLSTSRIL